MNRLKPIIANIIAIVTLSLLLIWGVTWYRQWQQFSRGERAESAGDVIAAVAGYEAAIHMYTPGSPFVERAAIKLWSLGEELERRGDREKALIAFRSLRSSFYSIRGLGQPGREWIRQCDHKIDNLITPPKSSIRR